MNKIILISLLVISLGGCTVDHHHVATAEKVCKGHKGVAWVSHNLRNSRTQATCKDGTYISAKTVKQPVLIGIRE